MSRPRLIPGFNPQALPEATPPVAGAQPWQWLADPATDPVDRTAYLERFVRGYKPAAPADESVEKPSLRERVIASHLEQDVIFDFDGAPRVTVQLSAAAESEQRSAFAGPVAIIGTIPPPTSAVEALGRNLREELQAHFDGEGIGHLRVTAVDRERCWVEPALLVDCTRPVEVRVAARVHLQPCFTVWRTEAGRSVMEVFDTADGSVLATGSAVLRRLEHRPCPLLPGASRAELCRMRGGPWTSGAIKVAAAWESNRGRMVSALGCDTCGDCSIKVFGKHVIPGGRSTVDVRPGPGPRTRYDSIG